MVIFLIWAVRKLIIDFNFFSIKKKPIDFLLKPSRKIFSNLLFKMASCDQNVNFSYGTMSYVLLSIT